MLGSAGTPATEASSTLRATGSIARASAISTRTLRARLKIARSG